MRKKQEQYNSDKAGNGDPPILSSLYESAKPNGRWPAHPMDDHDQRNCRGIDKEQEITRLSISRFSTSSKCRSRKMTMVHNPS